MVHDWHDTFKSAVQRARNITHKLIEQGSSPHEEFHDDWPRTVGTVELVDSEAIAADRGSTLFVGELSYSYSVNGEYYAGFYRLAAGTQTEAEAMLRGWKGRRTTVRYSPQNHALSVMVPYEDLPCI